MLEKPLDWFDPGRFYTTLDWTKGYQQIPLSAEFKEKTTFSTP